MTSVIDIFLPSQNFNILSTTGIQLKTFVHFNTINAPHIIKSGGKIDRHSRQFMQSELGNELTKTSTCPIDDFLFLRGIKKIILSRMLNYTQDKL